MLLAADSLAVWRCAIVTVTSDGFIIRSTWAIFILCPQTRHNVSTWEIRREWLRAYKHVKYAQTNKWKRLLHFLVKNVNQLLRNLVHKIYIAKETCTWSVEAALAGRKSDEVLVDCITTTVNPWVQAGPWIQVGGLTWVDSSNRSRGLLLKDLRYITYLNCTYPCDLGAKMQICEDLKDTFYIREISNVREVR